MTFDETTFKHDPTQSDFFDMGHYLNTKQKINTNNNMTQRLDKIK